MSSNNERKQSTTQQQDMAQYNHNGQPHTSTVSSQEQMEILSSKVQGEVILPGDPAYEAERKVWNGTVDCHPSTIVRCVNAEDVRAAVNFAREQTMTLSVRSGGHSIPGHSINDDELVIDFSNMRTMTIDPVRHTTRLEPGLTWGEVASSTADQRQWHLASANLFQIN